MKLKPIIFTIVLSLAVVFGAKAQVYELGYLLKGIPDIPATVVGVSYEDQDAFKAKIEAYKNYLDSLVKGYQHVMCPDDKANDKEVWDYNLTWDSLWNFQSWQQNKFGQLALEQADWYQEEFEKQAALMEKLRQLHEQNKNSYKDITPQENEIDKQMYDNEALYHQKYADALTAFIKQSQSELQLRSHLVKKVDTTPLPNIMQNGLSAAIEMAKHILGFYSGYSTYFLPPYTPKWPE